MNNVYPYGYVRIVAEEMGVYFDSVLKQRVAITDICKKSNYDYTVTFQPVLYFGLNNKRVTSYKLHASEIFDRFKIIARI